MAAGTVTLAAAYSFWLKNTLLLGNVAMAVLVASIPVYGAMAAGRVTLAVLAAVWLIWLTARQWRSRACGPKTAASCSPR